MSFTRLTVDQFFCVLQHADKRAWNAVMDRAFSLFGTSLPCNRFPVGELNEIALRDLMRRNGIDVVWESGTARKDLLLRNVDGLTDLSVKFVSDTKSVILHNAQRKINTDLSLTPTLLITPREWWLLSDAWLSAHAVHVKDYLKNNGDSLAMDLRFLGGLRERGYPYTFAHAFQYDRKVCQHKSVAQFVYNMMMAVDAEETVEPIREFLVSQLTCLESMGFGGSVRAAGAAGGGAVTDAVKTPRATPTCSRCGEKGHTKRTCSLNPPPQITEPL